MKAEIVPTITAENAEKFANEMKKLEFSPALHIDFADGIFAPNKTINLAQIYFDREEFSRRNDGKNREIDLHLMVENPEKYLNEIVSLAPETAIFHAENFAKNPEKFVKIREFLKKFEIKIGAAFLAESQPENFSKIVENADEILLFGGKLGFQGGKADLKNLEKIAKIRELNPRAKIAWDGGANAENVAEISRKGVQKINVGAAISRSENPEKTWRNLVKIANEK